MHGLISSTIVIVWPSVIGCNALWLVVLHFNTFTCFTWCKTGFTTLPLQSVPLLFWSLHFHSINSDFWIFSDVVAAYINMEMVGFLCACIDLVTQQQFHDGVFMLMFSRDTSCLTQTAVIVLGVDAGSGTLCGESIGVVLLLLFSLYSYSP